MLIVLIPIILLALCAISGISYYFAMQVIQDNTNEILSENAASSANKIEGWINTQTQTINGGKATLEKLHLSPKDELSYLTTTLKSNPNFSDLYIGTKDGVMISGSGWEAPDDYDPRTREWYKLGINSDTVLLTEPYLDLDTKKMVVSASVNLKDTSGKQRGVLASDISLEKITGFIKEFKYGKTGYAFLVDKTKGTILAHYDEKIITKTLADVNKKDLNKLQNLISSKQSSAATFNMSGKKMMAHFSTIPGTNWTVVIAVTHAEVVKDLNELFKNILITLIVSLLVIAFAIERASHQIIKPIRSLDSSIRIITQGDFTQEISQKNRSRQDEIGVIAQGIHLMQDSLRNLIHQVKQESEYIKSDVNLVVSNVENLYDNIGDVSATTEELSASMEETAASSQEMSATSQEIEYTVQQIEKRTLEGAIEAEAITQRADQTKANVNSSNQKAKEALFLTQQNLKEALEAAKVIEEIEILSSSIMQITAQTNLLALNASIEAARAGESGKGFSVVAEQIRNLAEQSKHAVLKIQETTSKVTNSVERLSDCAQDVLSFISTDVVNDYATLLGVADQYSKDAKFVDDLLSEFHDNSKNLLSSIHNIITAIDGVSIAANEGAKGTTDIANRVSDTMQKASFVQDVVAKTEKSTLRLLDEISKFRV